MNTALYLSFLVASCVILALPGPSFAYAVAVGARSTRRAILLNAVGMAVGGLAIAGALAFGAGELLAASPWADAALRVLGCAYLIGLGIRTFFAPVAEAADTPVPAPRARAGGALLQGFLVETANPKAILFYASLMPQFVDRQLGHPQQQLLVLGASFVALQLAWDLALMLGVMRLRTRLLRLRSARAQRATNRLSGATFAAMGAALLWHEHGQP
ncbi:LysE family translocator [Ideonella sp.]|uniref:LysE family translocator n=1 Tax=Ideonella sp. TaxID=1929293 RepID=UPI0035ADA59E